MMRFDVRGTIKPLIDDLSRHSKEQVPFATALALTRTAKFVEQKLIEEIGRVFDRPNPYTKRATYVRPATKQRLMAEVLIKDQAFKSTPPVKWLIAEIEGGNRRHKAFELLLIRAGVMPSTMYAVPTRAAPMDAYGNLPGSEISRILSDLKARRDPLQNATPTSKGKRLRSRTKRPSFYFSTYPPSKRTAHLAGGVYKRTHFGFGAAIQPILVFTRAPRYRQRFKFHQIADQVARMRFPIEFTLAMKRAIEIAR